MNNLPFRIAKNAPPPITVKVERTVRFEEVDGMGIVWHGKYASYFDDARKKMGDIYGFSYKNYIKERIKVPIKHFFVDYIIPLMFDETFNVIAKIHWCEAARMNMTYEIYNQNQQLATKGYTVQLFMDDQNELLLTVPKCVASFREKWQKRKIPYHD